MRNIDKDKYFESNGLCYEIQSKEERTVSLLGLSNDNKLTDLVLQDFVLYDDIQYTITEIYSLNVITIVSFTDSRTVYYLDSSNNDVLTAELQPSPSIIIPSIISVEIPSSILEINFDAFSFCQRLESINVSSSNPNFSSLNGVLYNKNFDELLRYPFTFGGEAVIVKNGIKRIGPSAFKNCTSLSSVILPITLKIIDDEAFRGCANLSNIKITSALENIGYGAFQNCNSIRAIELPHTITEIQSNAFKDCINLESITLPNILYIGESTFENCASLSSITIPSTVRCIGKDAFYRCVELSTVILNEGLHYIKQGAFGACEKLRQISLPNSLKTYESAFASCSSLESINILPTMTGLWQYSFNNCESLKSMSIPHNISHIYECAFRNCTHLTSVTLSEGLKYIFEFSFQSCISLNSIILPSSIISIDCTSFYKSINLRSITLQSDKMFIYIFHESNLIFESLPYGLEIHCKNNNVIQIVLLEHNTSKYVRFISSDYKGDDIIAEPKSNPIFDNGIVYVPKGLKQEYANAPFWKYFKNIVEEEIL